MHGPNKFHNPNFVLGCTDEVIYELLRLIWWLFYKH